MIYRFKDLHDAKLFTQSLRGNRDLIVRRIENRVEIVSSIDDTLLKILSIHYSGSAVNGTNTADN